MKLVILSNNPISQTNANGRTMLNMLYHFKNFEILNIFLKGSDAAFDKAKFYKISEKKILFPFSKKFGAYITQNLPENVIEQKTIKKSPFKLLIRSILWSNFRLKKEILTQLIDFNPDVICIQCGDSDFLIKIAIYLSNKINKPLICYNSEDYIFKHWNWVKPSFHMGTLFKIYKRKLVKTYDKLYKMSAGFIYLTESLEEIYQKKYPGHSSIVIYNSSSIENNTKLSNDEIIYTGNLSVGRVDSLIEISNLLYEKYGCKLKIFSLCSDTKVLNRISKIESIKFCGRISYEETVKTLCKSKMVIHVESFDDFYIKDCKNAFSTKIADLLMCGVPFLLYAPSSSFVSVYLKKNHCAYVCNTKKDLAKVINCIFTKGFDSEILNNAKLIAFQNHNAVSNSEKFYNYLKEVCKNA